nr:recombinase family protein [uncultured Acetatifactor sp.]
MNRQLKVALYMRISKEDEDIMEKGNSAEERHSIGERHSMEERQSMEKECFKEESNSIRTQRILLRSFAEEHFRDSKILEFKDDGYSGVTLERPGVSAMLELVKESVLDCIIVKDFSRFSRDYIELGTYLEQIFPFMGVRFISVNDNYDSEAGSGGAGGDGHLFPEPDV